MDTPPPAFTPAQPGDSGRRHVPPHAAATPPPNPARGPNPTLHTSLGTWREVTRGVYVAIAQPAAVTIGLIVGADGALLVDTGSTPAQGRAIRAAAERLTDTPLVGVVVTHRHYDHLFGLAGVSEPDGLVSYGHETLLDAVTDREVIAEAEGLGLAPGDLTAPTRPIVVGAAVDLGGVTAEIAHVGRGHTDGDVIVSITVPAPGRARIAPPGVVFVGDLLETAGAPWFGGDSYPMEWPGTLDGVLGLADEHTLLIPGHGDPVTRDAVFTQRGEISAVAGELRRLVESGITVEHAAEQGDWPFPVENVRGGIGPGYAALKAQGVRRIRPTLPLIDPAPHQP